MAKIFVTRRIPENGLELLRQAGHEVVVSEKNDVLTRDELLEALKATSYDAVLCLLTDKINAEVLEIAPSVKIFANYAVGFDNIDVPALKGKEVFATNTPGGSSNSVAEHAMTLALTVAKRAVEADQFIRDGKYVSWAPFLLMGKELQGKTLGIIGLGRIGSRMAEIAQKGFGMKVIYSDIVRNGAMEESAGIHFHPVLETLLQEADCISLHVPLNNTTRHLMNKERLNQMKPEAILVNTSRGPVIDEAALVEILKNKKIFGAGLDVFENEPQLAPGLAELDNVVLTPHIASATHAARDDMSRAVAMNIIAALSGQTPPNALS
ncbi:MAG: D-glycerate dehydrogenase [Patescibacteria group bacterium]|nr:D-glycerate dehydrogenase [Patescibacteria group bacterium]